MTSQDCRASSLSFAAVPCKVHMRHVAMIVSLLPQVGKHTTHRVSGLLTKAEEVKSKLDASSSREVG